MHGTKHDTDVSVLIVGAGPVGLTLAIDLAQRGVASRVVEKRAAHGMLPKMERVNPRTLEHFRRLGLANRFRAAGLPSHLPMDVFVTGSLFEEPLVRLTQPSVAELKRRGADALDGSMPLEPYHVISQYTLEPLLRIAAEEQGVQVDFGCELTGFEETPRSVRATLKDASGLTEVVEADFLIGCDGASSQVRKSLGVELEGEPALLDFYQGLIRSDDLYEKLPYKGRHYHFLDDEESFLIVQDDTKHFTLHARLEHADQMGKKFESIVGAPVEYEVLYSAPWTMRAMLANSYGSGRVFIAGDAAHLMPPTAGLGMNTGVGDAIDLAWKLQGAVQGWGGPNLLASYDAERRSIGAVNVSYSLARFRARRTWREAVGSRGAMTQVQFADLVRANEAKAGSMEGIELGYSYAGSSLFPHGRKSESPGVVGIDRHYEPVAAPGSRLPNVWVDPGTVSIQDLLPLATFTLLCLTEGASVAARFAAAFASSGAPFTALTVRGTVARAVYGCDFLLLRPDMHVQWAGDGAPSEVDSIVAAAIGAGASEAREHGVEAAVAARVS